MRALLLLGLLLCGGCWYHVEDYCAGCTLVDHRRVAVPRPRPGARTQVVLVHGAFGFGDEWLPVLSELRRAPELTFFAWTWPGPFHNPPRDARRLGAELQALLDQLPPSIEEILVLAHSAGGLISNLAGRHLRVPPGRRVTIALLDPAFRPALASADEYLPVPPGVTMRVYLAQPAPSPSSPPGPEAPDPAFATDLPREYLGDVGHNPMVGMVALPLLAARRGPR